MNDPKKFKEAVNIISDIVTDTRFLFTDDGIELVSTDPGNISLVNFKAPKDFFTEYEVKGEEEVAFDISKIKDIFKRIKPNNSLSLETEENKLKIVIEGNSKKTFYLPLLTLDVASKKMPSLEYDFSLKMQSSLLGEGLEDISLISDVIVFDVKKDKFLLKSPKNAMSSANIDFPFGENLVLDGEVTEDSEAYFSVEYLKKMVAASKISDNVIIKFKESYPLTLVYQDELSMMFILAPRQKD